MAVNFTEALLLTTDLILIIIVVYLLDRLRKIKRNAQPAKETRSSGNAVPQEPKQDKSEIKISDFLLPEKPVEKPAEVELKLGEPEKTGPELEDKQTVAVSPASSEPALKNDELKKELPEKTGTETGLGTGSKTEVQEALELEDRLLEELHAIPSEVKSETETAEPYTLKLEDEPPGDIPASIEPGNAKPGKVRKPRKKRSKSKKAANTEGAAQTLNGETKVASGKRTERKKKAAEQVGQMVEAKPAEEVIKPTEEIVKEEKAEELKEPQKDLLL